MSEQEPISISEQRPMCALIIVNWDYSREFGELLYPEEDGKIMKKTLETAGYENIKVEQNISDVKSCIERYIAKHSLLEMERFHFHYSGDIHI